MPVPGVGPAEWPVAGTRDGGALEAGAIDRVLALQRSHGNAYVQRLARAARRDSGARSDVGASAEGERATGASPRTPASTAAEQLMTVSQRLSVVIPIAEPGRPRSDPRRALDGPGGAGALEISSIDAAPGHEQDEEPEAEEYEEPQVPDVEEPEVGETIRVPPPEEEAPPLVTVDPVFPVLAPNATTVEGGAMPGPGEFGITRSDVKLSDVAVTKLPGGTGWLVSATVNIPTRWRVYDSLGPEKQVNVESAGDPDITKTKYPTVVSDLTPDMSDVNGRPPRTQFWARDLTIRHEKFHANEYQAFGLSGLVQAQVWLTGQPAYSLIEALKLLYTVPRRVKAVMAAAMPFPDSEERAFGDGVAAYTARANAIKTKGDAGKYP